MRTLITWAALAVCLFIPVDSIRMSAALILMTFFPGFVIYSFVDPEERNPLVFLICGAAFLPVLVYYLGWFLFYPIPLIISFVCVLILEWRKTPLPVINRRTLLLLGCIIFMVTYLYPWRDYTGFYPPGDEMKLHLLYTNSVIQEKALPSNYSPLYPEIQKISQPLGFHGVTALVADTSRTSVIPAGTFTGIFLASLGCVSVYLLGKYIFSEEVGLAASFSFSFLTFVYHQLGFSGSYIILTGITLYIGAAAFIVQASRKRSKPLYLLAGLFCAAVFSVDMNAFLPLVCFFVLILVVNRALLPVAAAFILFSLPQLAQFTLPGPTPLEEHFIQEWFLQNTFTNFEGLWIVLFSVGPLLIIFGLLEIFSHTFTFPHKGIPHGNPDLDPYVYVGLYTFPLFIPVLFGHYLPFWYSLNPLLIFRMICIPLAVLSGLFIVKLKALSNFKLFLSGLIVFSALIHVTDPFVILPSQRPTVDEDSLSAFNWIHENTSPGTSFCNFTSFGDSSTWIPVAVSRRVFLPFHLYYQGDNAMTKLQLPQRFTDSRVLQVVPDSEFAKDILEKYSLTYVYIDEKSPVRADNFLTSSLYNLEYHKGDVYIFSVRDLEPPPCTPVRYHTGENIILKTYFHFSNLKKGNIIAIYYTDTGFGNVDVEINDEYVGSIFRFDSGSHFVALFLLPLSEDINVSFLPYDDVFSIEYLVIYECE